MPTNSEERLSPLERITLYIVEVFPLHGDCWLPVELCLSAEIAEKTVQRREDCGLGEVHRVSEWTRKDEPC